VGRETHGWQVLEARVAEVSATPAIRRAHDLLSRWLAASTHLPVHDLLSAIYSEGDVLSRYRAAVPALMWPGVRANLEAFIALSLELGGGRYPSLTRFNDELKRLQSATDEAPDEGLIASAEGSGRVRILTIHAAKGLEAPLVWLIDANKAKDKAESYDVLLDWPPEADCPRHFSLFGKQDSRGTRRAHLFEQDARAALREELNLLYVALTRASQYFVASGTVPHKNSSGLSFYGVLREALEKLGGEGASAYGAEWQLLPEQAIAHRPEPPTEPHLPPLSVGALREEMNQSQRYGTALHRALESLSEGSALPDDLEAAAVEHARRIMATPQLNAFFDPAQYVSARNETEFALPDGSSGRIDRLVERADGIWILDYKAGCAEDAPLEDYRNQLSRYREVVRALHPGRAVFTALIFGDGRLVAGE
jgi:ATP-dependent helicase/nuclease subunit A